MHGQSERGRAWHSEIECRDNTIDKTLSPFPIGRIKLTTLTTELFHWFFPHSFEVLVTIAEAQTFSLSLLNTQGMPKKSTSIFLTIYRDFDIKFHFDYFLQILFQTPISIAHVFIVYFNSQNQPVFVTKRFYQRTGSNKPFSAV